MPVSSETSISGPYTPNGVTTSFAFDFKAASASEVVATDGDGNVISTALYSVTLDDDEGGTLTFGTAPEASDYSEIYVLSEPELTQPSDFDNAGPSFNPAALTRAIDRAAIRDLKLNRDIGRALKLPFGEVAVTFPGVADRANKFVSFLPNGDVLMSSGTGADSGLREDIASSTGGAMVGFIQSGTGAEARTIEAKARETISTLDYGATADGTTDDYADLVAARDASWAAGLKTLSAPDGVYSFGTALELAKDHWAFVTMGDNAKLKRTGAGVAVSLSGPSDDPNYGTYRGTLGGNSALVIEGNADVTRLLDVDNFHHGFINVDVKEGEYGVWVEDTILTAASHGAVMTEFRIRISQGNDGTFTTRPTIGFRAGDMADCRCYLLIEHCENGLKLVNSTANTWFGTVEGNTTSGIEIDANSHRNTFIEMFCEFNVGKDWDIKGNYNILLNCTGVASGGNEISGDYNQLIGGKYEDLAITSGAAYTVLDGVEITGSFTDSSATTTIRNCTVDGSPIADKAPRTSAALTMGTNISDYSLSDPTFAPCLAYRGVDGLGQISASLAAGGAIAIGDTIATIPSGYRPATRVMFAGTNVSANAPVALTLDSAGNLQTRTAISSGNVVGILSPPFVRG